MRKCWRSVLLCVRAEPEISVLEIIFLHIYFEMRRVNNTEDIYYNKDNESIISYGFKNLNIVRIWVGGCLRKKRVFGFKNPLFSN